MIYGIIQAVVMKNFIQKKQSRWRARIIGILIAVILLVIVVNFVRNWRTSRSIDTEIADLQSTATALEQQNVEFRQLIEYFNSSAYVEERARIDLGLKKRGEKVIIVPDQSESLAHDPVNQSLTERSNARKWLDYFFR